MYRHFIWRQNADAVVNLRRLPENDPKTAHCDAVDGDRHLDEIGPNCGIVVDEVPRQIVGRSAGKEEGVENALGIALTGGSEARVTTLAVQQELRGRVLLEDAERAEEVGGLDVRMKKWGDVVVEGGESVGRGRSRGGEERAEDVVAEEGIVGEVGLGGRVDGGERDERIRHPAVVGDELGHSGLVRRVQCLVAIDEAVTSTGGTIRSIDSLASNPVLFWKMELMLALRA